MIIEIRHFFDGVYKTAAGKMFGHTWAVRVTIQDVQNPLGLALKAVDPQIVRYRINTLLGHKLINDVFADKGFDKPVNSETIAKFISNELLGLLPPTVRMIEVAIHESYRGEDRLKWVTYP